MHFDPKLRDEVVARVERLHLPSYTGFVMPKLEAVHERRRATITDVTISYPLDLDDADARVRGRHAAAFGSRIDGVRRRESPADLGAEPSGAAPLQRRAGGRRPVIDLTESNPDARRASTIRPICSRRWPIHAA